MFPTNCLLLLLEHVKPSFNYSNWLSVKRSSVSSDRWIVQKGSLLNLMIQELFCKLKIKISDAKRFFF